MWDIILSLIYHRSSRKYLAAARTQEQRLFFGLGDYLKSARAPNGA